MPIRQEGTLASRASTWPRDHFCRSTIAPLIVAHDVERVLADIDSDSLGRLRHGVLLVVGAPCQLIMLAGQEHGRTIPLDGVIGRPSLWIAEDFGCCASGRWWNEVRGHLDVSV